MRRREFAVPPTESLAMRTLALTLETQGPLKWVETPMGGHYRVKPNRPVKAITPMSGKEMRRIERLTHSGPDNERPKVPKSAQQ